MDTFIIFIRYIISVAAVLGAGYAILIFFEGLFRAPREGFLSRRQRVSLSFLTGSGFLSIYLFAIGLLGARYTIVAFFPFFIVSFVLGALMWKRRRPVALPDAPQKPNLGEAKNFFGFGSLSKTSKIVFAAVGVLIAIHIAFIIFQSAFIPTYFDDAVHTWNLRAKLLFEHGGLFLDKTSPIFAGTVDSGFQMTSYPLYSTLIKIYFGVFAGGFFEPVINSLGILIALSVIGLLFFTIFRYSKNPFASIVIPYLVISLPLGEIHVASGYVDFLFGLIASAATAMLFLWLENDRKIFYLAAAVFLLGLAGFTKSNPFALLVIPFTLTVLIASFRSMKHVLIVLTSMIVGFGLLLGPWLAFQGRYPWQIFASLKLESHIDALPLLFTVLFAEGNYNIFFFGFIVFLLALVFKGFRARHILLIGFILFTMFLLSAAFLFSQYGIYLKDQTTFNRAMLALLPSLIFIVGITAYDWMSEEAGNKLRMKKKRA